MWEKIRVIFTIPELRQKIFLTLLFLAVYRVGWQIPLPIIDQERMREHFEQGAGGLGDLMEQVAVFSATRLSQATIFGLGIMPYISASIIMQLLAVVIPRLQSLQDEGGAGRKVITQWTRYLTVAIALIQSTSFTFLFHNGSFFNGVDLVPDYTLRNVLTIIVTMTAGTALIMWLGELITQRGVGNGMSLIIFVSVVSSLPTGGTMLVVVNGVYGDRIAKMARAFGIPVLEGDGPTECSPVTCVNPVSGPRKPGSVGVPVPGVEMRIAGADGQTLADGEHGHHGAGRHQDEGDPRGGCGNLRIGMRFGVVFHFSLLLPRTRSSSY